IAGLPRAEPAGHVIIADPYVQGAGGGLDRHAHENATPQRGYRSTAGTHTMVVSRRDGPTLYACWSPPCHIPSHHRSSASRSATTHRRGPSPSRLTGLRVKILVGTVIEETRAMFVASPPLSTMLTRFLRPLWTRRAGAVCTKWSPRLTRQGLVGALLTLGALA